MKQIMRVAPLLLLLFVVVLQGQDITKGSIAGVVRDPTGAVVPNATVKLTSPYGDRSTKTNSVGEYNFQNLVVGSGYVITVDSPGFVASKSPEISVGVNRQITQDFALQVGQAAQSVEVTATAAVAIDTSSATVGADLSETLYKNVPVGRNISAVIAMAPGVSDGGGSGVANPSINGASGLENEYVVNGANVTDPGFGGFGTFSRVFGSLGNGVNFDFIQEVQVKSGGFEAQYGQALGGVVNVLTKSGSNVFHGSFYSYFAPREFEATRPDVNRVVNNVTTRIVAAGNYDFGGDFGGYIKKDKLFFYGGFNPQYGYSYRAAAATVPLTGKPTGFANASLGTISVETRTLNYVGKINWNISSRHQLEGSVFGDPSITPTNFTRVSSLSSSDNLRESGLDYGSRTWTGRYNGALTNTWVVSANFSNYFNSFTESPKFNGYQVTDNTGIQEKTGPAKVSNGLGFLEGSESRVHEFSVTSSHNFRLLGSHTVDYGFQFEDVNYDDNQRYTGPNFQLPNLPAFGVAAGKTQFGATVIREHMGGVLTNPIVYRVTRGNYSPPGVAVLTRYGAGFIEDAYQLGTRITIKPGLRFEQQAETGTAFRYVFAHNWAPRIGVIVDPTGNRKSKFFANWGRFFEKIPLDIAVRSFSFESGIRGNLYKDQGAGNAPDLSPANYIPGGKLASSGGPDALTFVAGGTKAEYQDEVVGGYEHEFNSGFTFSGRFVYRHMRRIIEDISGINVTQNNAGVAQQYVVSNPSAKLDIFKNADPCTSGPKCDLSTGFTNIGDNPLGSDGRPDGFPNPSRIYKAMELIVSKRLTTNLQVYASYRLSKLYGNFEGSFRNDNGQQDPNISSLFDFTNTDGQLGFQTVPGVLPPNRTQQFKFFGNYQWKAFNFGAAWLIQSGTPITKLGAHPAYSNAGEIPLGPRGSLGRTDVTFPLDLHGDYTLKLGEKMRLKFLADLFNIGNQTRVVRVDQLFDLTPGTANPDFLKPDNQNFTYPYQRPFNARLAVRFDF